MQSEPERNGPAKRGRPPKTYDAVEVAQSAARDMPSFGDAMLDEVEVVADNGGAWKGKAEELAFMEEPVEIMIHETTDKNAEPIVETWCNGRSQFFIRGRPQVVKRKFVALLARARNTAYSQQRYQDAEGNDAIRNVPHTALKYPFSVIRDSNPRGVAWLREVMNNG